LKFDIWNLDNLISAKSQISNLQSRLSMENLKLNAQKRTAEENAKSLIKSGFVPAVVYGPKLKTNKLVKVPINDLKKVYAAAGESTLIDLNVDGKKEGKILIKDEQRDPVKDNLIHVDFYEVDMAKEIHTEIPLHFVGESKAVKELAGVLIRSINEIEVRCLPTDLVSHIDVDISGLATFDDVIKIHDLKLPAGIKLVHETDDVVATVAEPKAEEVFETTPAEGAPTEAAVIGEEDKGAEAAAVEGEDKGKKEEKKK
jgi:large subunit ribosomal protein L25